MTNSELFVKAHELTKKHMLIYKDDNYRAQFGLYLSELYKFYNMTIEEKIAYNFNTWANKLWISNTEVVIKNYKNLRIYINIKHGKYSTFFYIDLKNYKIVTKHITKTPELVEAKKQSLKIISKYKYDIVNQILETQKLKIVS
jgi:hypothetical protein